MLHDLMSTVLCMTILKEMEENNDVQIPFFFTPSMFDLHLNATAHALCFFFDNVNTEQGHTNYVKNAFGFSKISNPLRFLEYAGR